MEDDDHDALSMISGGALHVVPNATKRGSHTGKPTGLPCAYLEEGTNPNPHVFFLASHVIQSRDLEATLTLGPVKPKSFIPGIHEGLRPGFT